MEESPFIDSICTQNKACLAKRNKYVLKPYNLTCVLLLMLLTLCTSLCVSQEAEAFALMWDWKWLVCSHCPQLSGLVLQAAHNQLLSEFPSNTWDKGTFRHVTSDQNPLPHKYGLLRIASSYQKCRWVIMMTNLHQRVSAELVTSSCQPIINSHEVLTWPPVSLLTRVPPNWNWVSVSEII